MILSRKFLALVLFMGLISVPGCLGIQSSADSENTASALAAESSKNVVTPEMIAKGEKNMEVKGKLDAWAKKHVEKCNASIVPSKAAMSVKKTSSGYLAEYKEIDPASIITEIQPGNTPGTQYVGDVIYLEKTFQNSGKTQQEAKNGSFRAVKVRRVREIIRYDKGVWQD